MKGIPFHRGPLRDACLVLLRYLWENGPTDAQILRSQVRVKGTGTRALSTVLMSPLTEVVEERVEVPNVHGLTEAGKLFCEREFSPDRAVARPEPKSLEARIRELRTRIVREPLSLDEQAWLLDTCDALRRQGEQLIYQAESQINQFRDVVNAGGRTFPETPGRKSPDGLVIFPPLKKCQAGRDGECWHPRCPQIQDGEPKKSGRHCPIDHREDNEEDEA